MTKILVQVTRVLVVLTLFVYVCSGCGSPNSSFPSRNLNEWMGANDNAKNFASVDGSHKVVFPKDHGPHEDYLFEWWYLTAILDDFNGREFGVQFTIFRRALSPDHNQSNPWRSSQIYLAHFAISDIQQKNHRAVERFSRAHPKLAGAQAEPFRVFVDDWQIASAGSDFFPLELTARTSDCKVDLTINRGKPVVLHGIDGFSQKSPDHASYYYSYTRLPTSGTIEIDGKDYAVSGTSWLDREWSSQVLNHLYSGWYWFSLSFNDGRELVLFALNSIEDSVRAIPTATWIARDGTTIPVSEENWSISPRRFWKSHPVEWALEVDGIQYIINAKFDSQFMDLSIRYWEGVVEVRNNEQTVGQGYVELTGY